jgi:hypothetical protein
LRQTIEFTRAFNSVADELELLAKGLRDTVASQRFEVARKTLSVVQMMGDTSVATSCWRDCFRLSVSLRLL